MFKAKFYIFCITVQNLQSRRKLNYLHSFSTLILIGSFERRVFITLSKQKNSWDFLKFREYGKHILSLNCSINIFSTFQLVTLYNLRKLIFAENDFCVGHRFHGFLGCFFFFTNSRTFVSVQFVLFSNPLKKPTQNSSCENKDIITYIIPKVIIYST